MLYLYQENIEVDNPFDLDALLKQQELNKRQRQELENIENLE